jgi:hypothetical protein
MTDERNETGADEAPLGAANPLTEEEKAALMEAKHAAYEAELMSQPEEGGGEEPEWPLRNFQVELLCPTPVEIRTAVYRCETAVDAEALHRKANGLVGAIAGAMRVTPLD